MPAKRGSTGTLARRSNGRAGLAHIDATTDAGIARQNAADPDTAPEFTDEMFARATWMPPLKKVPVALRMDPDILDFFRRQGPGYQSRINAVLRSYVQRATPGPAVPPPGSLLTLAEAERKSGIRSTTLRVQLNAGRLKGIKRGRDWYVDPKVLTAYMNSRSTRGRRPVSDATPRKARS